MDTRPFAGRVLIALLAAVSAITALPVHAQLDEDPRIGTVRDPRRLGPGVIEWQASHTASGLMIRFASTFKAVKAISISAPLLKKELVRFYVPDAKALLPAPGAGVEVLSEVSPNSPDLENFGISHSLGYSIAPIQKLVITFYKDDGTAAGLEMTATDAGNMSFDLHSDGSGCDSGHFSCNPVSGCPTCMNVAYGPCCGTGFFLACIFCPTCTWACQPPDCSTPPPCGQ